MGIETLSFPVWAVDSTHRPGANTMKQIFTYNSKIPKKTYKII